jgi:hypothetical protein
MSMLHALGKEEAGQAAQAPPPGMRTASLSSRGNAAGAGIKVKPCPVLSLSNRKIAGMKE